MMEQQLGAIFSYFLSLVFLKLTEMENWMVKFVY